MDGQSLISSVYKLLGDITTAEDRPTDRTMGCMCLTVHVMSLLTCNLTLKTEEK